MNNITKKIVLAVSVFAIVGSIYYLESTKVSVTDNTEVVEVRPELSPPPTAKQGEGFADIAEQNDEQDSQSGSAQENLAVAQDRSSIIAEKEKKYERAKEITTPDGYINTEELYLQDVIGKKVILIDFWTYSCINCQRTIPYLNAWQKKYEDSGLVIFGVHTPEFEFEKEYDNVLAAVEKFEVKYPVVLDNDFSTWRAYRNRYWPRKYLIDIDGFIVYDHIGEGAYEETEAKIQELLAERNGVLGISEEIETNIVSPDDAEVVQFSQKRTPEIYFGAWRNNYFANGESGAMGNQQLSEPAQIFDNLFYLVGDWNLNDKSASNNSAQAKIILRYTAEKVFLVAGSTDGVKVKLLRDGKPLVSERGEHVSEDSSVFIQEEGLYRLVEENDIETHTLEIIIENPGLEAFAFTFG